jgi:predicted dehydrogenase
MSSTARCENQGQEVEMSAPVRIGVLGASRIVKRGLVLPARQVPEVRVTAIAARDADRARAKATELGIPASYGDYQAVLEDPNVDAVYIALPNALHAPWSIRAMRAGKHVLCEKPVTSNADEALALAEVSEKTGHVIAEAMHSSYHALYDRLAAILADGAVGEVLHVEALNCFPIPSSRDIRWQYGLGGGAVMDVGVYAITMLRHLAGMEPAEVTEVTARLRTADADRRTEARLRFPNGATGRIVACMWGWPVFASKAQVIGTKGKLAVQNPTAPQYFNKIEIEAAGRTITERVAKSPDSYTCQLRAFADAVLHGKTIRTGPEHFLPNMRIVDQIYCRAGLPVRGASPEKFGTNPISL